MKTVMDTPEIAEKMCQVLGHDEKQCQIVCVVGIRK